jgi:hypothetical protein
MNRFVAVLLAISLLVISAPASGQTAELSVRADTVGVGVPFEVTLLAQYPEAMELEIPYSEDGEPARWGDIVLLALESRSITTDERGLTRDSLVFRGAAYVPDSATTDGAYVDFSSRAEVISVPLNRVVIPVATTVAPGAEPRDVLPISRASRNLLWPLVLAAILGVVAAGVYLWRRRRRVAPQEPSVQPASPLEEALRALDALASETRAHTEQDRAFVIRLSEILRQFISRRLHTPALERTSAELMRDLERHPVLPSSMIDSLKPLLISFDGVKFAAAELRWQQSDLVDRVKQWIVEADRLAGERERPHAVATS